MTMISNAKRRLDNGLSRFFHQSYVASAKLFSDFVVSYNFMPSWELDDVRDKECWPDHLPFQDSRDSSFCTCGNEYVKEIQFRIAIMSAFEFSAVGTEPSIASNSPSSPPSPPNMHQQLYRTGSKTRNVEALAYDGLYVKKNTDFSVLKLFSTWLCV